MDDIIFLGLSPYDNNQQINNFKAQYGLQFPCAGPEGSAPDAIQIIIDDNPFFGYPSYNVICPDKKLNFSICFPPTPDCFDPYFESCSTSTAVDQVEGASGINVYPNPATDLVWLNLNLTGDVKVVLYDVQGQTIMDMQFNADQSQHAIDVSDLSAGLYLINVKSADHNFTYKLRVQ